MKRIGHIMARSGYYKGDGRLLAGNRTAARRQVEELPKREQRRVGKRAGATSSVCMLRLPCMALFVC